jgi:thiamine biosynthesis lipoprotein
LEWSTLRQEVADELERIEQIFSLFRAGSELTRFNAAPAGEWINVSNDLHAVTQRALALAERTGGAFDPTVGPLVRLWRIHDLSSEWSPPAASEIARVKQQVGHHLMAVRTDPPAIRKLSAGMELDLNALVEGWALDQLAAILRSRGCHDVLIEVGGEFRGLGRRGDGEPWLVGIEDPGRLPACYATVALENAALATSGSYRQARMHRGTAYAHILDPRTGSPVQHELAAVSVLAGEGITADGWATALMVLGPVAGRELAEREDLAASFVPRTSSAGGRQFTTNAEKHFRKDQP